MEKKRCPTCGHNISEREIALYRGLVSALWRVFKWCKQKGIHEFSRKDIKHLFTNENDTARFGDWVLFGGLVYKPRKARYGLNMERCEEFFAGRRPVPTIILKNPISGEIKPTALKLISEIPSILEFLNEDMEYVARYRTPERVEETARLL